MPDKRKKQQQKKKPLKKMDVEFASEAVPDNRKPITDYDPNATDQAIIASDNKKKRSRDASPKK